MEFITKFINFIKAISDTKSRIEFVISSLIFTCYLFSPLQIIENLSNKRGIYKNLLFLGLFIVIYFTTNIIITAILKIFSKILVWIKKLKKKIEYKKKEKKIELFYKELISYANLSERSLLKRMFDAAKENRNFEDLNSCDQYFIGSVDNTFIFTYHDSHGPNREKIRIKLIKVLMDDSTLNEHNEFSLSFKDFYLTRILEKYDIENEFPIITTHMNFDNFLKNLKEKYIY
ncbi:MAG: hypothetical protein JW924_12290 [Fusobacteriaceae bacterium]|nr:hypothetical protein [Fusobacteriaceae bacterium]